MCGGRGRRHRAAHLRRARRAGRPAGPRPGRAWRRGRRPRRPPPAQRPRVHRGHARQLQAAGRPGERELPLRRRRAAATCSTTRAWSRSSPSPTWPTSSSRGRRRSSLRSAEPIVTGRGLRGSCSRPRPPGRSTSGHDRPTTSTSSTPGGTTGRPKGVVWRHEDIYFASLGGRGTPSQGVPTLDGARADRRAGAPARPDHAPPAAVPAHPRRGHVGRAADAAERRVAGARHRPPLRRRRSRSACWPASGSS